MLISYNSEIIQKICFSSSVAIEYLGEEAAISLQARHSDIQAAGNVYELPFGRISVNANNCTLIVPNILSISMIPNYVTANGTVSYDWSTVGRVKLMGINDVE